MKASINQLLAAKQTEGVVNKHSVSSSKPSNQLDKNNNLLPFDEVSTTMKEILGKLDEANKLHQHFETAPRAEDGITRLPLQETPYSKAK
jgi:hypothetical protein